MLVVFRLGVVCMRFKYFFSIFLLIVSTIVNVTISLVGILSLSINKNYVLLSFVFSLSLSLPILIAYYFISIDLESKKKGFLTPRDEQMYLIGVRKILDRLSALAKYFRKYGFVESSYIALDLVDEIKKEEKLS
jgi:Zn-dependent protease with chaperone function